MPIFQDDLGGHPSPPAESHTSNLPPGGTMLTRKLSEESIRTELCEGPLLESPRPRNASISAATPDSTFTFPAHETSGREELIERLKKGNINKAWWPSREVRIPLRVFLLPMPKLKQICSSGPYLTTTRPTCTLLLNEL